MNIEGLERERLRYRNRETGGQAAVQVHLKVVEGVDRSYGTAADMQLAIQLRQQRVSGPSAAQRSRDPLMEEHGQHRSLIPDSSTVAPGLTGDASARYTSNVALRRFLMKRSAIFLLALPVLALNVSAGSVRIYQTNSAGDVVDIIDPTTNK